jgi:hypothetical protein
MTNWIARAIAGFGFAVTFGCWLYFGSPGDADWWRGAGLFMLWALSPYAIVFAFSLRWSSPAAQVLLAIGGGAAVLPMPFLAYDAFQARRDAMVGLVFLFVPVYQLSVVIAFVLAAWWWARREFRRGPT